MLDTLKTYRSLKDNNELRRQAMLMFFSGKFYPTEIASMLSVDINELGYYVFGKDKTGTSPSCWHNKLQTGDYPKFIEVYEEIKTLYVKKTEKKLLDAINDTLDKLADNDEIQDFDTKDLANLVNSMEKIDKIGRLEEGKATSHTIQERPTFTLRDIDAKVDQVDQVEDIPYTELPKVKS